MLAHIRISLVYEALAFIYKKYRLAKMVCGVRGVGEGSCDCAHVGTPLFPFAQPGYAQRDLTANDQRA